LEDACSAWVIVRIALPDPEDAVLNVFRSLDPHLRRNLVILFATGLLFWASLASLLPTLSLYIQHVGATQHQVGIVMGAFAIGLLLFRPWVGRLADRHSAPEQRFRDRRRVLFIGVAAVAIAPLGYLLTQSILVLGVIRAFHGLSIAAFTTAYSALVADCSPPRQRGEVIGYMTLVNPIGVALGPALGGFLLEWAGYTPLFLMASGLGVISLVSAVWLRPPPSLPVVEPPISRTDAQGWALVWSPRLRIPTVVMLLVGLAFGTLSTFVPLFIQETGVNFNAGLFYTAAAIASFSMRLLTGRASDRYGRGAFITGSLVLYTIAMLLLWQADSPTTFLLAGVIEGAGAGILIPVMIAMMTDRSHPQERGRVFSLCMAGFDLGMAIAGPTLGYFAAQLGYRGLFGLAGSLTFLAFLLFISQSSKTLSHSLRFAFGQDNDWYALPHQVDS